jgi:hypothetical protein
MAIDMHDSRTTAEKLYHHTFGEYRCDNFVGAIMYRLTTESLEYIPFQQTCKPF